LPNSRPAAFCFWAWAAVIIGLAFAARLYHINSQSIWFDEGWSAYAAAQPDLVSALNADATNPPLYYGLLNLSSRAFGDSHFGLRWFSLVMGILVLPAGYQLARRLFDRRAGLYAMLALATSPLLWWASQEARMYTLMALLLVLVALGWHQLLRRPQHWAWALVLGGELALLYTHNTGPVVALWLNIVTLLAWIRLRRPDWRAWLAGQIAVGLAWLPYFLLRFLDLGAANQALISRPQIGLELIAEMWQALWAGSWKMVGEETAVMAFAGAALLLWLALIPWRQANARWLVLHALALSSGLVLGLWVLGNELHGRYLVMIAPLALVPLGAGIARLPRAALRRATGGLLVIGLGMSMYHNQNPAYQHDDARAMVAYYAERLAPVDTMLAWSYADRYELWYYWDRLGVTARRVTLPEGADLEAVAPLLPQSGDVALNVWYTQRADYRGMLDCILSSGTRNPPEAYHVQGMSNLLYTAPRLQMPPMRAFDGVVLAQGVTAGLIERVGEPDISTAERALCLPLDMKLLQRVEGDIKAAVIVSNPLGWQVARADAVFATANQRLSSALDAGETATAYALLRLPYGAPPGDYDLRLRVYDETGMVEGYDLRRGDDGSISRELVLGTWRVAPGADWSQVRHDMDWPRMADLPVGDVRLVAHDAPEMQVVTTGQNLRLSLLWQGDGTTPPLTLAAGDSWSVTITPTYPTVNEALLDWRTVRLPLDAAEGDAELRLPDGTVIARYRVSAVPLLLDAPAYTAPVGMELPGVGELVGYTVADAPVGRDAPLHVTLVWRAGEQTPNVSYTVFVQLLDATGQLIAQSDSIPAQAQRPTTGWRAGEYIIDDHELRFNSRAAPGLATLIAGMYDPVTGRRVLVGETDFIRLPGEIMVQ
jgi:hypothetical protein